jgi:hypothetical protein
MTPSRHYKSVSPSELAIDPRVQRLEGVSKYRVGAIVEAFNPLALGTICVSQREDGMLVVLDGAHRVAACKARGYRGFIDAEVFTGLSLQDEAAMFRLLNQSAKPSAISSFLVRVVEGDPVAVDMSTILYEYGWHVRQSLAPGSFVAVTAGERVYRRVPLFDVAQPRPGLMFEDAVSLVTEPWQHDYRAANGLLLDGVGLLLARWSPAIDRKKLVHELALTRPDTIVGQAKALRASMGGTVPGHVARVLVSLHNSRRRTNLLPEWTWVR